jgi:hypothetical protein
MKIAMELLMTDAHAQMDRQEHAEAMLVNASREHRLVLADNGLLNALEK